MFAHEAWRRRMNHELAELYGEPSILTAAKAGRIRWLGHVLRIPDSSPTKKVFDSDLQFGIRRRGHTANSMAGPGEARPDGDRVSAWMGGCSQGPSILDNCCGPGHVTPTCSIVSRPTRERERHLSYHLIQGEKPSPSQLLI